MIARKDRRPGPGFSKEMIAQKGPRPGPGFSKEMIAQKGQKAWTRVFKRDEYCFPLEKRERSRISQGWVKTA